MSRVEQAVSCFKEGFSCSQALLSTYGVEFGLDRETALKVSGAFGGGMGRMGETCGAVTGAFMVIGLKYGNTRVDDRQAKEKTYSLVKEFVDKFKSRNGSIVCRELLGCDISTPEGMEIAKEKNLFATLCPKLVSDAAEIIEQTL
ncbi:MAG: C-GCAxxG-C-C family protein [Candidatus Hodarchaeota archaeon]